MKKARMHIAIQSWFTPFTKSVSGCTCSSVGTVLVPEVGCSNGTAGSSSTLDCITNGSVIRPGANLTDGSMGMVSDATFCTVSVASAVYISCGNRDGGKHI